MPSKRLKIVIFQFHKGAIRTFDEICVMLSNSHFNSIKVRLEQRVAPSAKNALKNFNSIKVRLEHNLLSCWVVLLEFQFHKGAIRTGEDGIFRILL